MPEGFKIEDGYLFGPEVQGNHYTHENFSGLDLQGVDLSGVQLIGSNFTDANLRGVNLEDTDLRDITLTNVQSGEIEGTPESLPTGYKIISGYLIGPGVNLSNIDLSTFDLSGLSLKGANLSLAESFWSMLSTPLRN